MIGTLEARAETSTVTGSVAKPEDRQ
jgi:hypothetical protein